MAKLSEDSYSSKTSYSEYLRKKAQEEKERRLEEAFNKSVKAVDDSLKGKGTKSTIPVKKLADKQKTIEDLNKTIWKSVLGKPKSLWELDRKIRSFENRQSGPRFVPSRSASSAATGPEDNTSEEEKKAFPGMIEQYGREALPSEIEKHKKMADDAFKEYSDYEIRRVGAGNDSKEALAMSAALREKADAEKATLEKLQAEDYDLNKKSRIDDITSLARSAPDFKEMTAIGTQVKERGDGQQNLISMLNDPKKKAAGKLLSALPSGPMLIPGTDLGKNTAVAIGIGTDPKYAYIEDPEADIIRYLHAKGDKKGIDEFLKLIDSDLNKKQTEGDIETLKKVADNAGGILGTIMMEGNALVKGFDTPVAFGDSLINTLSQNLGGEYKKPDPYSPAQRSAEYKKASEEYVTSGITRDIKDPTVKKIIETAIGVVNDSAVGFIPGVGPAFSILGTAGESAHDAVKNGASYNEAFREALANALPGAVAEKIPGGDKFLSKWIGSAAKDYSAKAVSDLIGGKKSAYESKVKEYMGQNLSREEAENRAAYDIYVKDQPYSALESLFGGFISKDNWMK